MIRIAKEIGVGTVKRIVDGSKAAQLLHLNRTTLVEKMKGKGVFAKFQGNCSRDRLTCLRCVRELTSPSPICRTI